MDRWHSHREPMHFERGRSSMPTFMCFLNWADQAAKALKDAPKRYEATKALVTKLGGRLVCAYVTTGQYDVALVVEMPNGDGITQLAFSITSSGNAHDNRACVCTRRVWKARRRSAHDDPTQGGLQYETL